MIKTILFVLSLCAIGFPAFAQEAPPSSEPITFGVGIIFSPTAIPGDDDGHFGTAGMTNFSVPVKLGPYIRFEPELGLFFKSYQEQIADTSASMGVYLHHIDHQIVRAGFGVFYTRQPYQNFEIGLGARIGVISSEYEMHSDKASIDDTDIHYAIFYLGGSFSVDYYLSQHFSIGGELQFIHYDYGSPLETVGTNPLSGYSNLTKEQSVWSTNEVLSAKFWF